MDVAFQIALGTVAAVALFWWNDASKISAVIYSVVGAVGSLLTINNKGCIGVESGKLLSCLTSGGFVENKWMEISISIFIGALLFLCLRGYAKNAV